MFNSDSRKRKHETNMNWSGTRTNGTFPFGNNFQFGSQFPSGQKISFGNNFPFGNDSFVNTRSTSGDTNGHQRFTWRSTGSSTTSGNSSSLCFSRGSITGNNNSTVTVNDRKISINGTGRFTCTTSKNGDIIVYTNGTRKVYSAANGKGHQNEDCTCRPQKRFKTETKSAPTVVKPTVFKPTVVKPTVVKSYDESELPVLLDGEECTICYEQYRKIEDMKFLPCAHYFHKKCVEEWQAVDNTCPVCRTNAH